MDNPRYNLTYEFRERIMIFPIQSEIEAIAILHEGTHHHIYQKPINIRNGVYLVYNEALGGWELINWELIKDYINGEGIIIDE